jgi:hypothetical protein
MGAGIDRAHRAGAAALSHTQKPGPHRIARFRRDSEEIEMV